MGGGDPDGWMDGAVAMEAAGGGPAGYVSEVAQTVGNV